MAPDKDSSNNNSNDNKRYGTVIKTESDLYRQLSTWSTDKVASQEIEPGYRCGYLCYTPDCLQRFNTPRFLLLCVSWFTFVQGFVVNGVIFTNFTSWERRYGLTGTHLAWIAGMYDTFAAVFTIIFGYIGQWMHNGRILAIGSLCMGFGSFLMAMPHFIGGPYELGPKPVEMCDLSTNGTVDECALSDSNYYAYFIIAQCFHGIGGAAVYTLAVPYMDEQIKTKNTPLYIGIMYGNAAFGPAMGFIIGGMLISVYVDVNRGIVPDITPNDPRWVGAWWIGLLAAAVGAVSVSFFIGCFPRELPSAAKYRSERVEEAHKGKGIDETKQQDFGKSLHDFLYSIKIIFTNPVLLLMTLGGTIESAGVAGLGAFLPKMMQFQFAQPPTQAAIYAGLVVIPGAAGGQILGGLIPKWLKLRMRGLILQCLICSLIALPLAFQFLIRCDTIPIAGVTVSYFNNTAIDADQVDVVHPCNTACNCTTESYDPICGEDSIEYFSPCHAGCLYSEEDEAGDMMYSNCSCIPESVAYQHSINNIETMETAGSGICPSDCTAIGGFLVLFLFINLATFISATAGQAATLRCVPDKNRQFAFGIRTAIVRILGSVPGAIIIGAIFDSSCLVYQESCDVELGSCWIYDTQFIAQGLCVVGIVIKAISALCFGSALLLYKPPPLVVNEIGTVVLRNKDKKDRSNGLKRTSSASSGVELSVMGSLGDRSSEINNVYYDNTVNEYTYM